MHGPTDRLLCGPTLYYSTNRRSTIFHTLINSRHFLEGMQRGWWAETSITSTASPSAYASSSACLARRPRILLEYHP